MKTRLLFEDASYPDYRACCGLFLFPTFSIICQNSSGYSTQRWTNINHFNLM